MFEFCEAEPSIPNNFIMDSYKPNSMNKILPQNLAAELIHCDLNWDDSTQKIHIENAHKSEVKI